MIKLKLSRRPAFKPQVKLVHPNCASCLKAFESSGDDLHPTENYGDAWICKPCFKRLQEEQAHESD